MNALVPKNTGVLTPRPGGQRLNSDLTAGIRSGYSIVGYKGKIWSIKNSGETRTLKRADGDGNRHSIEVVLVKAATGISKIYYEGGYVEGSTAAPTCSSATGLMPDIGVPKKMANACATCPMNIWGSATTTQGKPAKACKDHKRLAIVPAEDILNERDGGPMLLRVPGASLKELTAYAHKLEQYGYKYDEVTTKIAFADEAFPKFVITPGVALTPTQLDQVAMLHEDSKLQSVLSEAERFEDDAPASAPEAADAFAALPPRTVATATPQGVVIDHDPETGEISAPAPVQKREYKKKAAPAPAPVEEKIEEKVEEASTSFEDDLDAQLDALLKS